MKISWLHTGARLGAHLQNENQNNFTLIRLLAALIVVKQHSFSDAAENYPNAFMSVLKLSALGLPSFFFISGLLVSESLRKSGSWKNFLWKRFLRLFPAAWLSLFFCAFVLGPAVTTLPLKEYFTNSLFYQFLSTAFLFRVKYYLPGVFDHSHLGNSSVNAPLWTICLELKLYIGLLIFWALKILHKKYFLFLAMITLLISSQFFLDQTNDLIFKITGRHVNVYGEFTCCFIFLTGVLANIYRNKILIRNYWIFIIVILWIAITNFYSLRLCVFIFIPVVNLFVATKGMHVLKKITPKADLSYGIYVFAYPVQQLVANYLHPQGTWMFFLFTMIIILPFAIFSWFIVEKKALSLKRLVV